MKATGFLDINGQIKSGKVQNRKLSGSELLKAAGFLDINGQIKSGKVQNRKISGNKILKSLLEISCSAAQFLNHGNS